MNAALRHDRRTVHEAKNLALPSVHPRLFSQLPKHDGGGHTLLQATELQPKGHLNIRHLPFESTAFDIPGIMNKKKLVKIAFAISKADDNDD